MMHFFGANYMNRRLLTPHRLLGSASRFLPSCVVMMLLTVPVLLAQEPAATAGDPAATAHEPAAMLEPAATPEEAVAKPEEPAADVAQPKASKTLRFSWDTTLKYSNAFRLLPLSSQLVNANLNPSNVNQDDGDRNFHGGLISNRGDLLSEIDLTYGSWGVRASVEAWLDTNYNQRTANNSPYTNNNVTTNYLHFTNGTQEIYFLNAQLLDAFGFGKVSLGSGSLSFRGGQYAQFWGEALYFGNNGIAGAMAPIDVVKAQSVPF